MVLPDLKQLKSLLKLLRAEGVLNYNTPELQLVLSELPPVSARSKAADIMESDEEELTPEQEAERILFYSATAPTESQES